MIHTCGSSMFQYLKICPKPSKNIQQWVSKQFTSKKKQQISGFFSLKWPYVRLRIKSISFLTETCNHGLPSGFKQVSDNKIIDSLQSNYIDKVHIFWEGQKIFRNLYCRFDRYYIGQPAEANILAISTHSFLKNSNATK